METIRQQLEQQRGQDNSLGAETPGMGDDGLIGDQVSLDRKLDLLASAQQGLTGVNSAINALAEQYPALYSYASMQHFQQDIFDAEIPVPALGVRLLLLAAGGVHSGFRLIQLHQVLPDGLVLGVVPLVLVLAPLLSLAV